MSLSEYCEQYKVAYLEVISLMSFERETFGSIDNLPYKGLYQGLLGDINTIKNLAVGKKDKVKHRAEFGIGIEKGFWGIGIGRALTMACIECAKAAGYAQLELNVVSDNRRAISLYEGIGFREYGRNPKGFRSRTSGWQEIVLMRMELD